MAAGDSVSERAGGALRQALQDEGWNRDLTYSSKRIEI